MPSILLSVALAVLAQSSAKQTGSSKAVSRVVAAQKADSANQNRKDTAAGQRGTDSLPVSIKLLNTGKSKNEVDQEDRRANEAAEINQKQLVANIFLGLLSVIAVAVSWYSFHQTRRTTRQELRAYIGIPWIDYLPQSPERVLLYEMRLKNYGQTPAFEVSATMTRKVLKFPLPSDYVLVEQPDADQAAGAPPATLTLQPGTTRRITSSRRDPRLVDAEIEAFTYNEDGGGQETQLYCYGTITYRDVFGQQHWARYCKSFGGEYYSRTGKGMTSHLYNDSSDDPKPAI